MRRVPVGSMWSDTAEEANVWRKFVELFRSIGHTPVRRSTYLAPVANDPAKREPSTSAR